MNEDFYGFKANAEERFGQFQVPFELAINDQELRALLPRDGIVLIHAPWSGYSITNTFRILKTIRDVGVPFPKVVIANIDGLSHETMISLIGGPAHGYAEGVVVHNGKVVAVHSRSDEFEPFLAAVSGSSH